MNFRGTSNVERPAGLPSDGTLTPETWKCIQLRIQDFHKTLEDLGFYGSDDPIRQHVRFCEIIKQFQTSCGIMPSGLLCEKTIGELITKWKALKPV